MSRTVRRLLFWIAFLCFLLVAFFLLLYSGGYRFSSSGIVQTGGLFIAPAPSTDVTIFINDVPVKTTSILSRNAFIQSLTPGEYLVRAHRDGYVRWEKTLRIYPELVAEIRPILVPDPPNGELILRGDFTDMSRWNDTIIELRTGKKSQFFNVETGEFVATRFLPASSTRPVLEPREKLFIASSTPARNAFSDERRQRFIWWQNGEIWIQWFPNIRLPFYTKEARFRIYSGSHPITNVLFYPKRDAILATESNQVLIIEIDPRGGHVITPLYKGRAPIITVPNPNTNELYVLDDGTLIRFRLL